MTIDWTAIDHVVITCADIKRSVAFYGGVLGMRTTTLPDGRTEVHFGRCKLNLQPAGRAFAPARNAGRIWSANICLLVENGLDPVVDRLQQHGVCIEQGPVEKIGALGPVTSVYVYDPDDNLIEISEYRSDA
ncbi:VOC family protein [Roseibium aggregatum]|uniref:VOC family protein n=1 Tax=Roseibium aggregatum TaxID=187304 RepID=A0A939EI62_9HYPH|nr:VOC family protein [Roseibium aggregatum]MBN9672175.1 VOC family protein [Roseibium aggregatum]